MPIFKSPAAMTQDEAQQSHAKWDAARDRLANALSAFHGGVMKVLDTVGEGYDNRPVTSAFITFAAVSLGMAFVGPYVVAGAVLGSLAGSIGIMAGGDLLLTAIEDRTDALRRRAAADDDLHMRNLTAGDSVTQQTGPSLRGNANELSAAFSGQADRAPPPSPPLSEADSKKRRDATLKKHTEFR